MSEPYSEPKTGFVGAAQNPCIGSRQCVSPEGSFTHVQEYIRSPGGSDGSLLVSDRVNRRE